MSPTPEQEVAGGGQGASKRSVLLHLLPPAFGVALLVVAALFFPLVGPRGLAGALRAH